MYRVDHIDHQWKQQQQSPHMKTLNFQSESDCLPYLLWRGQVSVRRNLIMWGVQRSLCSLNQDHRQIKTRKWKHRHQGNPRYLHKENERKKNLKVKFTASCGLFILSIVFVFNSHSHSMEVNKLRFQQQLCEAHSYQPVKAEIQTQ